SLLALVARLLLALAVVLPAPDRPRAPTHTAEPSVRRPQARARTAREEPDCTSTPASRARSAAVQASIVSSGWTACRRTNPQLRQTNASTASDVPPRSSSGTSERLSLAIHSSSQHIGHGACARTYTAFRSAEWAVTDIGASSTKWSDRRRARHRKHRWPLGSTLRETRDAAGSPHVDDRARDRPRTCETETGAGAGAAAGPVRRASPDDPAARCGRRARGGRRGRPDRGQQDRVRLRLHVDV